MITRVRKYIKDNRMLKAEDMVVAGVSGGADSIAMLHILKSLQKEIGFSMEVVHVHHGIRGQEADRDEQFVEKICRDWGIPFRSRHYPVPELSGKWKLGEEETGRIVRKQAFQEEKKRLGFSGEQSKKNGQFRVALAHNRNDLAETMLHHLARGTGIRGLSGIQAVNGEIIRPVLCLERKEIVNYLKERGISYITDSSNLSDDYTRNRIRNHILPAMEQKINAKAVEHMAETARVLAEADSYLQKKGRELLAGCRKENGYLLDEKFFAQDPILQEYAVMEAFEILSGKRKDFTSLHVDQVLSLQKKENGRYINLPESLRVIRQYGGVCLKKNSASDRENAASTEKKVSAGLREMSMELPVPGILESPFGVFESKIFSYKKQKIEEKKYTKWLDYDKIKNSLLIRNRQPGDYFVLDETGRTQKLKQYFVNEKILKEQRDTIPLVADGAHILWIVGYRISAYYKVSSTTKTILEIQYYGGREDNE